MLTCANCYKEIATGPEWTEEDKLKELKENFGDYSPEDCVTVCGECYEKLYLDKKEK